MSALTKGRQTQRKDGILLPVPVLAATKLFAGGFVVRDTTGYGVSGVDTADHIFEGVADDIYDNTASGAANGDVDAQVWKKGVFLFACTGMAITDVGKKCYVLDDQTVGLAVDSTNFILCGKIVAFVSATAVWIDIDVDSIDFEKAIYSVPIVAVASSTTIAGVAAISRAVRVTKISVAAFVIPIATGALVATMAVHSYDASADADDNLISTATFDLEGITTAKEAENLTLSSTLADLILAAGDYIHTEIVADGAIATAMEGGVLTVECEIL